MAIYKLGDISIMKSGSTPLRSNKNFWKNSNMLWLTSSEVAPNVKTTKEKINSNVYKKSCFKKTCPIMAMYGVTAGKVGFLGKDMYVNQAICVFDSNKKIISNNFLYYILLKSSKKISKLVHGAAQQNLSIQKIASFFVNIPKLNTQQQIIDIIEPLNKLIELIKTINKKIEIIGQLNGKLSFQIMNYKYSFGKGQIPSNKGTTPFLNVSAANGNLNRYVSNNPNIFPGDITLSLDGNTGLVNKNLLGFNGYLYKVTSNIYANWEIYYSLKHFHNQRIIKINETGTTIKHSPNSKKQLMHINFKNKDLLKKMFDLSLGIETILFSLSNIRNRLINILIK